MVFGFIATLLVAEGLGAALDVVPESDADLAVVVVLVVVVAFAGAAAFAATSDFAVDVVVSLPTVVVAPLLAVATGFSGLIASISAAGFAEAESFMVDPVVFSLAFGTVVAVGGLDVGVDVVVVVAVVVVVVVVFVGDFDFASIAAFASSNSFLRCSLDASSSPRSRLFSVVAFVTWCAESDALDPEEPDAEVDTEFTEAAVVVAVLALLGAPNLVDT